MSLPIPGWPEKKDLLIRPGKPKNSRHNKEIIGFNSALSLCEDALRKACEVEKIEKFLASAVEFDTVVSIFGLKVATRHSRIDFQNWAKKQAQALRDYLIGKEKGDTNE